MTRRRIRNCVMAEKSLPHLLRPKNEHGCSVTQQQAAAFLNAYEMWKHMMRAGEEFVAASLLDR